MDGWTDGRTEGLRLAECCPSEDTGMFVPSFVSVQEQSNDSESRDMPLLPAHALCDRVYVLGFAVLVKEEMKRRG
jgi:hypothetical protein